jgi:endonuclease III
MRETLEHKRARVRKIIARLKKAHPDAKLALDFSNPLELLIALILAAQARDDVVNKLTPDLFRKYQTAADWANEKTEALQQQLSHLNFYRNKTRAIQNAGRALLEKFGGQVPEKLDDLLSLPGVGRKTANILLGNAFGTPAIGVDTHVARLSQRLGLVKEGAEPDEIEAALTEVVPCKDWVKFCHLLQYHGRRVCVARVPNCPECTINQLCPYQKKTKA